MRQVIEDEQKLEVSIRFLGVLQSVLDVESLELVGTGEHTGSGNSSEDVGASSLHQGHEPFVLQDLREAVQGALVLDGGAGGHHHPPSYGILKKKTL